MQALTDVKWGISGVLSLVFLRLLDKATIFGRAPASVGVYSSTLTPPNAWPTHKRLDAALTTMMAYWKVNVRADHPSRVIGWARIQRLVIV